MSNTQNPLPTNVQRWVDALRSGDYKQGCEFLRGVDGRFCCLGVLCDISELHTWDLKPGYPGLYNGHSAKAPEDVAAWVGCPRLSTHGEFVTNAGKNSLSLVDLNDTGSTFAEIADYIEQNWPRS